MVNLFRHGHLPKTTHTKDTSEAAAGPSPSCAQRASPPSRHMSPSRGGGVPAPRVQIQTLSTRRSVEDKALFQVPLAPRNKSLNSTHGAPVRRRGSTPTPTLGGSSPTRTNFPNVAPHFHLDCTRSEEPDSLRDPDLMPLRLGAPLPSGGVPPDKRWRVSTSGRQRTPRERSEVHWDLSTLTAKERTVSGGSGTRRQPPAREGLPCLRDGGRPQANGHKASPGPSCM